MPDTLPRKEQQLLRALLECSEPITAPVLAKKLGVSERTVRTRVQAVNRSSDEPCIKAGPHGYTVSRKAACAMLDAHEPSGRLDGIPQTSSERTAWIVNRLLRSTAPLNAYDLCEEIFVSISTMKSELSKVKRHLARFDLELKWENDLIGVSGSERGKRRLLSQLLYDEASASFLDLDTVQQAFPDIDASYVKRCVQTALDRHRHFMNDYSLVNLILHIAIAIDRIRNNGPDTGGNEAPGASNLRPHEYDMAREIVRQLESHFGISFSPGETTELALMLASRSTVSNLRNETRESIQPYVSPEMLKLTDTIIGDIGAFYYIDLSEREFFVRFALHIKNLLVRAENNAFAKNPLTSEIRSSCPMLYEAAVDVAGIIRRETGFSINEDEIAYIAFHLGSTLETQKQLNSKVKTVLYCPAYYNVDKHLASFLEERFHDTVLLVAVVTSESDLKRIEGAELVIATSPVRSLPSSPVYQIGIVPREGDAERIRNLVARIRRGKRRDEFRSQLEELVLPDLFITDSPIDTREGAIRSLCAQLEETGFVDPGYEDEIWERERLSPTAFGAVAIPHALRPHANKSGISVLVPKRAINWSGARVQLVLMLSFSLRERSVFSELFDPLVSILVDPANVDKLAQTRDYREFIDLLSSMLE